MKDADQHIRVFDNGKDAEGNLAAIYIDSNKSELSELLEVSRQIEKKYNIATTCFVNHCVAEQYNVRCFNAESEIQCCGHGMIAAAKTIFSDSDLLEIKINEELTASYTRILNDSTQVALSLPRLLSSVRAVPNWLNKSISFNSEYLVPDDSAVSDKDDGYILFEFGPLLKLDVFSALQLDLKQVCDNTKRAVVLMQFEQEKQHLYIRYFAPQYGVAEDSATGSVMRFVADYIEKKYQCSRFDVSQCSIQGGFMKVDCKKQKIIITANATIET